MILHLCLSNDILSVSLTRCNVLNRKERERKKERKKIVTSIEITNSLYVADYYAASS